MEWGTLKSGARLMNLYPNTRPTRLRANVRVLRELLVVRPRAARGSFPLITHFFPHIIGYCTVFLLASADEFTRNWGFRATRTASTSDVFLTCTFIFPQPTFTLHYYTTLRRWVGVGWHLPGRESCKDAPQPRTLIKKQYFSDSPSARQEEATIPMVLGMALYVVCVN